MTIRAVIFDVGGVLSRSGDDRVRREWAARLGLSPFALADLIFENPVGRRATLGQATPDEVWEYVRQELRLSLTDMAALQADFWRGAYWDTDLLAFVRHLRGRCKTAVLSDAWLNAREVMSEYVNDDLFDVIMFSAEEGVQKPDQEIFRRILTRLDVAPGEAIFVDDRSHNVEGACLVGIHGILFESTEDACAQITALIEQH